MYRPNTLLRTMASMRRAGKSIELYEVGPREGMQANELQALSQRDFLEYLRKLAACGFKSVETTACVPLPQMRNHAQIIADVATNISPQFPTVEFPVLVPNTIGLDTASKNGAQHVAVFTSASNSFSQKNKNRTREQDLGATVELISKGTNAGLMVDAYISMVAQCHWEGPTTPDVVKDMSCKLIDAGARYVSLGDTTGAGTPDTFRRLLDVVIPTVPPDRIRLHLHDTYSRAVESALLALNEYGITRFDVATGGLGGCPFSPGATGNVRATTLATAIGQVPGCTLKPYQPELAANTDEWIQLMRHISKKKILL